MLVTLSGRVILVRLLQSSNALSPMLVTPSGRVTLVRLLQPRNDSSPMLVTPSGRVMLIRMLQYSNASFPMLVTPSSRVTLVRLLQYLNASFPMLVTPFGTTTSPPRPLYFCNTPFSITKSFGLLICVSSCCLYSSLRVRIATTSFRTGLAMTYVEGFYNSRFSSSVMISFWRS